MDLPIRTLLRPTSLAEAVQLLSQHPEARPLAGGTDLVVQLRDGRRRADTVVDLSALGVSGITVSDHRLEIAACTTMAKIAEDPSVRAIAPALAEAAALVGAWPIQCRATLGGNLANASPAADTAPPLLVANARVRLVQHDGERELALTELFRGPGQTAIHGSELMTAVIVEAPQVAEGHHRIQRFLKVGPRREQVIAVINLAGQATVTPDGRLADVRLALGAVAPTPIRARRTEAMLEGARPDTSTIAAAARAVQAEIAPISDQRAPQRYRRLAAAVLIERFLESTRA
jgi:CO/xanthine dehydrogenase FAD-binding subunit